MNLRKPEPSGVLRPQDDAQSERRLTELARGLGCGRKLNQADLIRVVAQVAPTSCPDLIVGTETLDDATVMRLGDELAVAVTIDFVAPMVDDPYDFGRIAATNALSDIYAMGAVPRLALNLVAFPTDVLPLEYLVDILRGGADVAAEAGMLLGGGHTVEDPELKYGLCVLGTLKPGEEITNATARPGDLLVLTKPLGTGIVSTAVKCRAAEDRVVRAAIECMVALNRDAALAGRAHGAHAMTDVTGFGLLGHLHEMCAGSGVSAELWYECLSFLEGVRELAEAGMVPGGTRRNLELTTATTRWFGSFTEWEMLMSADAQTSGGLLIAVPEESAPGLVAELRERNAPASAVIGRIGEHWSPLEPQIAVYRSRPKTFP